jgi:hypothetical protein
MINQPLFNLRTIKRLTSNISISNKQKFSANIWLKLLEENKLKEEKANYFKFAEYILKDILGYDVTNFNFEEGSMEFFFKDKLNKPLVCFEIKSTKCKDLWAYQGRDSKVRATPVNQIWDYMSINVIPYGILTNYDQFVLFDRTKSYNSFYTFNFSDIKKDPSKLKEFISIFSKENIEKGFIEDLKVQSSQEERIFTQEFYKLFHETRLMLIKEFEEKTTKEEAIHFAQLFLNRLMFIYFAEDTDKLPQKLFENIILHNIKKDEFLDENTTSTSNFINSLFLSLDKGTPKIHGFNGGLFKEEIPANLSFKDYRSESYFKDVYQKTILKEKDKILKEYPDLEDIIKVHQNKLNPLIMNMLYMAYHDFNSEVNVNILGHIFEQSLSDLEQLQEGQVSKRKKDGVFYTPEYITDYICRNTIIPYLSKTKDNIDISVLINDYKDNIKELEDKIKQLKILDPACGSGAFLIKAVDVLLEIYKNIEEYKDNQGEYLATNLKLKGRRKPKSEDLKGQFKIIKFNAEEKAREIIDNCIYGVDLNEESVEITKLSLFLKIATKGKKLPTIDNKIKCGNSLIDDVAVVGEKAFDWQKEFPDIVKTKFKVTIDTNVDQKRIKLLENDGFIKVVKTTLENKSKTIKNNVPTPFVLGYSKLGGSVLGDGGIDITEINKIIGKNNIKDSIIFQTHLMAKSDLLITEDNDILNNKEILQKKYDTKIMNLKELELLCELNKNKGFDIVIGNPPYVNVEKINYAERKFFLEKYNFIKGRFDLYVCFIEKVLLLLKKNSLFSFIIPYPFLYERYSQHIREEIGEKYTIKSILDLSNNKVFLDAIVRSIVFIINKNKNINNKIEINKFDLKENKIYFTKKSILQKDLKINPNYSYRINLTQDKINLLNKLSYNLSIINDFFYVNWGARTGNIKKYIIKDNVHPKAKKMINGKNIKKYYIENSNEYMIYDKEKLYNPMFKELFENPKLFIPDVSGNKGIRVAYDEESYYAEHTVSIIIRKDRILKAKRNNKFIIKENVDKALCDINEKYVLTILNSNVINFYFKEKIGGGLHVYPEDIKQLPIKIISTIKQISFIEKADLMINLNKKYYEKKYIFLELLKSNYLIKKETNKLKYFYNYEFKDLLIELKKQKIDIKLSGQTELLDLFNKYKKEIIDLKQKIDFTENEIDQLVYNLYNLTSDEIKLIEGIVDNNK